MFTNESPRRPYHDNRVVVVKSEVKGYPVRPPFHPSAAYPELMDLFGYASSSEANPVFEEVRRCLEMVTPNLEDQAEWNPLGRWIRPGNTVLLKPNLVKEIHPRDPHGWTYTITHGSVIRAVADYVWKALKGQGRVIMADAPQTDSSFSRMRDLLGLNDIRRFYLSRGLSFEVADLRNEEWTSRDGVIVARHSLPGDPEGNIKFNLGESSEFAGHTGEGNYYGADYDHEQVNYHHSGGRHEYLVSGTAIKADVIISLPKLKTHKKAGVTASLKNLIGVNGDKNWLPHHTERCEANPGDERPHVNEASRIERAVARKLRALG